MSTNLSVRDVDGIANKLKNKQSFYTSGSLRGETHINSPKPLRAIFNAATNSKMSLYIQAQYSSLTTDYVVFSYDTPIAFYVLETGLWTVVDYWYSQSTSRHQSTILKAIAKL